MKRTIIDYDEMTGELSVKDKDEQLIAHWRNRTGKKYANFSWGSRFSKVSHSL